MGGVGGRLNVRGMNGVSGDWEWMACTRMHENKLNFYSTFGTWFEHGMQVLIGTVYGVESVGVHGGGWVGVGEACTRLYENMLELSWYTFGKWFKNGMQIFIVGMYGVIGGQWGGRPKIGGWWGGEGVRGGWVHAQGCMKICWIFMVHLVHDMKIACCY